MKKLLFAAVAVFAFSFANAQETKFGATVGFASLSSKVKIGGASATGSDSGFYIGGFADIGVSEKFHVQPELLYVSVGDANQIQVPILAKFSIAEGFNLLAGPQVGFLMDTADGIKSFNYGVDFGASYDINEQFMVQARYDLGLANLVEDGDSDNSLKLSGFYVGVGYKF